MVATMIRPPAPSEIEDRTPHNWLLYGPTFVVAARADTVDVAVALTLVRLGYANRPELADELNVRQASSDEVAAIYRTRPVEPLHLTSHNRRIVTRVALAIRDRDLKRDRSPLEGQSKTENRAPRDRKPAKR